MKMTDEHIRKCLESTYLKINEDERKVFVAAMGSYNDVIERLTNAQNIYLKSLQKHNEKNEKMDDTAIMMYTALLDDRYDVYE